MTADERKRGLRAAVRVKAWGLEAGEEIDLLWQIIDSLVEECESLRSAPGKDLPCWICGKLKGQPPERCPGHYEGTSSAAGKED